MPLQCQSSAPSSERKRKCYISFNDEERAQIGQFAAENGNAALKKFKSSFPDLGESTVRRNTWNFLSRRDEVGLLVLESLPSPLNREEDI